MLRSLVGSEMCIRDRSTGDRARVMASLCPDRDRAATLSLLPPVPPQHVQPSSPQDLKTCQKHLPLEQFSGACPAPSSRHAASGLKATCSKGLPQKKKPSRRSRNSHAHGSTQGVAHGQENLRLQSLAGCLRDVVERHRQTIMLLAQGEVVDVPCSLLSAEAEIPEEFRPWMLTGMVHDLQSGLITGGTFEMEVPHHQPSLDPTGGLDKDKSGDGTASSGSRLGVGCCSAHSPSDRFSEKISENSENQTDVLSSTPKAPATPDLSYIHEAVSKGSSLPSPWCLQFEPVVEGAFLVWRGKQQFFGLCLAAVLQFWFALTKLFQEDAEYGDEDSVAYLGGFGAAAAFFFASKNPSHATLEPAPDHMSVVVGPMIQNSFHVFYLLAAVLLTSCQLSWWLSVSDFRFGERQARWLSRGIMVLLSFNLCRVIWVESHDIHTRSPEQILEKLFQTTWRFLAAAILLRPSPLFQACWLGGLLMAGVLHGASRELFTQTISAHPVLPMTAIVIVGIFWLSFWERQHFVDVCQASPATSTRLGGKPFNYCDFSASMRRLVAIVVASGDELCASSTEALHELVKMAELQDGSRSDEGNLVSHDPISASQAGRGAGSGTVRNEFDDIDVDEHQLESFFREMISPPGVPEFDSSADGSSMPSDELPSFERPSSELSARIARDVPFAEELFSMIYDACGVVDLSSGALVWRNKCFDELLLRVGKGEAWTGQNVLYSAFLQEMPRGVDHRRVCTIDGVPPLTLTSTARLVEAPHASSVLWVIELGTSLWPNNPSPTPPGGIACKGPVPSVLDSATNSSVVELAGDDSKILEDSTVGHPTAAEYTDPTIMIMTQKGSGTRQASLLWRRYGRKSVSLKRPGGGSTELLYAERNYFKCCQSGCTARLKIDVDRSVGERLHVSPSGRHNHAVEIANVKYGQVMGMGRM
eukprot:TRINITY_DN19756_c0_g3_i10.p1 TRINITY_DN19756_c0_g3~~TRINITY_DN19756_c0_g3_i10.p1  ORF type:complete len:966 (-),score=104.78 TRINITY_DN19756_c0_g3_i10:395-3184(-)